MTKFLFAASTMSLFIVLGTIPGILADDLPIKATEHIKKNPAMVEMLKKIELSKKILAEMQKQKSIQQQKDIQLEEIRKNVQNQINNDLKALNNIYEQQTPQNAFSRVLADKPDKVKNIYLGMFDYQQQKIQSAKDARDAILLSGGSKTDAWTTFYKISSTTKTSMIDINKKLNLQYGQADENIQKAFDKNGKLPRSS